MTETEITKYFWKQHIVGKQLRYENIWVVASKLAKINIAISCFRVLDRFSNQSQGGVLDKYKVTPVAELNSISPIPLLEAT